MKRVRARTQRRHGLDKLHRDVLHAMNAALVAADPARIIRKNLKLTGSILHVGTFQYPLKDYRRIFVVGGGKASGYMAEEIEKLLGNWITRGLVIIPDYLRPTPRTRRIIYHPATPDSTTYHDVELVLKKYDLWFQIPKNARRIITHGLSGSIPETPKQKDKVFRRVQNVIVGNNRASCLAAASAMTKAGYRTQVLSIQITGEAREAGRIFGSIVRDMRENSLPFAPPASWIAGVETTVTV